MNIKSISKMLPILGLMLLVLFSPCKVRNFIQVELGFPQTDVYNKSLATINTSNCSSLVIDTNTFVSEKSTSQLLPAILVNVDFIFNISYFSTHIIPSISVDNHATSAIPLYILYQNFKNYL